MKVRMIILTCFLLLSGCAVQKYDGDEYKRIVTAATTISPKVCSDQKALKTNLSSFADQMDYIQIYEAGLPNNSDTVTMLNGVQDETIRFQNLVNNTPSVSWLYCDKKVTGVRHTLSLILKAEGTKMQ